MSTWNLYNVINQCYLNKFYQIKINKKACHLLQANGNHPSIKTKTNLMKCITNIAPWLYRWLFYVIKLNYKWLIRLGAEFISWGVYSVLILEISYNSFFHSNRNYSSQQMNLFTTLPKRIRGRTLVFPRKLVGFTFIELVFVTFLNHRDKNWERKKNSAGRLRHK